VLEDDPAEQATTARIGQLRGDGISVRGIITRLTAEGITLRSGRAFTPAQLHRILKADRLATV
jgi:hypothetical protein